MIPWLIVAGMLALSMTGAAGMYGGYEIATARHAQEVAALQSAQIDALNAKAEALKLAVGRGDQVASEFLQALKDLKIVNTTINKEVRTETQKLIYTDCKLPDSGADLLKSNADAVNMRLFGGAKK